MSKLAIIAAFVQIAVATSPLVLAADTSSLLGTGYSITSQEKYGNGKELLQQGWKLYQTEQFSSSVQVLQQAVDAFKVQGDVRNQASALNYLALAYQQEGNLSRASQAIAQSLQLLRKNQLNYDEVLAQALNTQGQIQLAQGQSQKALGSWQEATALYTKNGDDAGKIGSQINQAQALQALGLYRRSLITLNQVNQHLQKQPDSLLKANGLLSLGNALRVVGVLEHTQPNRRIGSFSTGQAISESVESKDSSTMGIERLASGQALEQSLKVAYELNSRELIAQIQLSLGNTYQALANTNIEKKQEYTFQALEYYQQAADSSSPMTRLQAQINQLRLSVQTGQQATSQASWMEIESTLAKLAPSRKTIYARINLAQSLSCLKLKTEKRSAINSTCVKDSETEDAKSGKMYVEALPSPEWIAIAQIVKTAVDQAKGLEDKRAESYALGTLGGIYEQNQQLTIAQTQTQQALSLAESIQAPDIGYRWQWQLGRILKATKNKSGAIAAYTKAVDNLKSLRTDLVAVNPDVQFSFKQGVEPVFRELVSLLLESTNKQSEQENLNAARDVIESLRLAELDNYFRLACINAKPVQIDKVDRTAAVIYPVILSDRLEVIVSVPATGNERSGRFFHHTILKSKQEVEKTIDELRQKLETRSNNDFLPLSMEVYKWIITPIETELANRKVENLVFVLDDPLGNIPMGTLHDGKQYLVEKYNIAVTPGLQLLNPQPIARQNLRVIAGGLSEATKEFVALPNVKVELDAIKKEVANTRVLLNKDFSKKAIENAVQSLNAPIVHLATHGQFSSNAEDTFILTYGNQVINVKNLNSLLQSRETNRQGAIELLVLSACSTATGDKKAALGIAGVAVRSGARSTLASLWTVDDEGTSLIMREFYAQLKQPKITKAKAIKLAQLKMLKDPLYQQYQHPYYWAPYVLVGNWL